MDERDAAISTAARFRSARLLDLLTVDHQLPDPWPYHSINPVSGFGTGRKSALETPIEIPVQRQTKKLVPDIGLKLLGACRYVLRQLFSSVDQRDKVTEVTAPQEIVAPSGGKSLQLRRH